MQEKLNFAEFLETLQYACSSKTERQTSQNQYIKVGFGRVTAWGRMEQCLWLLSKRADVDGRVRLEVSFLMEKGRFETPLAGCVLIRWHMENLN